MLYKHELFHDPGMRLTPMVSQSMLFKLRHLVLMSWKRTWFLSYGDWHPKISTSWPATPPCPLPKHLHETLEPQGNILLCTWLISCSVLCTNLFIPASAISAEIYVWVNHPYPYRGGGRGGTKPSCRIPFFLLGNPGIVIQPRKWNCKVTILNKPWALVRKYLRLAPPELSASMVTAAQFLEGCHPYIGAASVWHVLSSSGAKHKYLIFICLPMTWNDEEYWSLIEKAWLQKWNFKMKFQYDSPPPFLRG